MWLRSVLKTMCADKVSCSCSSASGFVRRFVPCSFLPNFTFPCCFFTLCVNFFGVFLVPFYFLYLRFLLVFLLFFLFFYSRFFLPPFSLLSGFPYSFRSRPLSFFLLFLARPPSFLFLVLILSLRFILNSILSR